MADEDDSSIQVIISWSAIWVTLLVAIAQSIIFYLFFAYQRSKERDNGSYSLYEPRHHNRSHRSPRPFADRWWSDTWNVSQAELLRCVGLDSYMFLRFLRLGARMASIGTGLSLILIPIYATGNATGAWTLQFNRLTLARVEQGSSRLWATTFCWWSFIAFVLYEFWTEWKLFYRNRHDFVANGDPDTPLDFCYAIRVEQLPLELRTREALFAYFERIFPTKVRQATVYLETGLLEKLCNERQIAIECVEKAVAFTRVYPYKPRPRATIGGLCFRGVGEEVDAIEHFSREIERLNEEVDVMRASILSESSSSHEEENPEAAVGEGKESTWEHRQIIPVSSTGAVSSTGVVTFSSLRAKQSAIQCEISGIADNITVFSAADPEGILWKNITVSLTRQKVLGAQVACLWIAGILFWTIPISFVTSLANLNSILAAFGVDAVDSDAAWYGLVAGLLPVIFLAVFMVILYMAIKAVGTHWIRFKSLAEVDAYALYWHQFFHFANLWLILFSGSFFNQLDSLLRDPTEIIKIIAKALPGASVFFVNMIAIRGLGNFGLELSMLPYYGITLVKNLLKPEALQTQRMLDDAKTPPVILWSQIIPPHVFVFLVMMMYMPIVPLMELFALVYFGGTYIVWKHQCLHVYSQPFEGGGLTWESLFGFLMASIYMSEGVFIAYMGIKEAPGQAACGFVPLVASIMVHVAINKNIRRPLQNLSLQVATDMDLADGELENIGDNAVEDQIYAQPVLRARLEERRPLPYRHQDEAEAYEELDS